MSTTPIAVTTSVILAGGLSRRMFDASGDKGLLALGHETMLERVIRRLSSQIPEIVLNANGDPSRFAKFNLPIVSDPVEGFIGPLAGVLAGLQWVIANNEAATHIVTVSSDVPFLPLDLIVQLTERAAASPYRIVLAASGDEVHPVIGCWPVRYADDLAARIRAGERKVISWAERHGVETVHFGDVTIGGIKVDPFFNTNTPAELEVARQIIRSEHDDT